MHAGPMRAAVACCVTVAVALGLGACGDAATGDKPPNGSSTLTIYSSLPLHGRDRDRSRDMVNAIKLALQEGHGKIGNFSVTYVSLDSSTTDAGTWTRDRVLENARQAVRDQNTIAYIGDLHSAATALALPLVNEGHILMVSPGSTYDGLTRPGGSHKGEPERFYPSGKLTFGRVVPPDHVQASAIVGYMKEEGVKRLELMGDRGLYGGGMLEQMQRAAQRQGVAIVDTKRIDARSGDLSGPAKDVASSGADAFFFAGETDAGAQRIFNSVAAGDPSIALFAPSAVASRAFVRSLTPSAARRMRITTTTLPPHLLPRSAGEFLTRFRTEFARDPSPDAMLAYEAAKIVLRSIHNAGKQGNNRNAVVDAFLAIRDHPSILGRYSIDRYGDTSLSTFAGNRVRAGKLVLDKVLKVRG
ncbi:MAG: branched-chain amino acid transport system substrate-binding protein [Solirubrobacteraceae bacterium]|jgi:branched-chain amino acid transport system substrate-binding protein|nr:branched-chain amino acid transport system substrate-binding protein [Solirubrobacteraceae bacterium]